MPGHKDTALSEDSFDILSTNPPLPPIRIDSSSHRHVSSLTPNRNVPPPPYNAQHITSTPTRLTENREEVPGIPIRDPPPYPHQPMRVIKNGQTATVLPEEATARFITTRPQINILKAHTSIVGENQLKPSYAAPTVNSVPANQQLQQHQSHHILQQHPNTSQGLLASTIGKC